MSDKDWINIISEKHFFLFFFFYWEQCIILHLEWFTQRSWKLQISIFCSKKIDLSFNHQIGIFLAAKYHLSFRTIITSRRNKLVGKFFCVFLKCSHHLQHLCIFSSSCWWNHTHLVIINFETCHFKKKNKKKSTLLIFKLLLNNHNSSSR